MPSPIRSANVFQKEQTRVDPNMYKNYKEDVVVQLAVEIDLNAAELARLIYAKIFEEKLPLTSDLPKFLYALLKDKLQHEFISPDVLTHLHMEENNLVKSRTFGAVLREEVLPFGGGTLKAVVVDNQKREVGEDWTVNSQAACVNPYCYLVGQYLLKGKDGKTDYYCPKCKTTWHWIEAN